MTKRIALIGVGLIGKERLKAIQYLQKNGREIKIVGIHDTNIQEAKKVAEEYHTIFYSNLNDLINAKPDWFFIATPHDTAFFITLEVLKKGFKVLIEKPLGCSLSEAKKLDDTAIDPNQLWVGFNYRFFDGIAIMLKDINEGKFGKLISVNCVLGHGGNPSMKESWKIDPVRAGGGCLIDPGVHVLDLCRLISKNNLNVVSGVFWKGFWNSGIEEECHILLESSGLIFNIQISIVRWRSKFTLEINGVDGYGKISGRNRSFGNQTYIRGKRWGWLTGITQKDSEEFVLETDGEQVFAKEIEALLFPNSNASIQPCSSKEALINMQLLDDCCKVMKLKNIELKTV